MDSLTFARIDDQHFALINNILSLGVTLDQQALDVLGTLLKRPTFDREAVCSGVVLIVRETSFGGRSAPGVYVELNGSILFEFTLDIAAQVGIAAIQCARLLDETANRERIAVDNAILLKSGVMERLGLGLTNDPDIRRATAQEAASNPVLRRNMGAGVPGEAIVGTPTLLNGPGDTSWDALPDSIRAAVIKRLQEA